MATAASLPLRLPTLPLSTPHSVPCRLRALLILSVPIAYCLFFCICPRPFLLVRRSAHRLRFFHLMCPQPLDPPMYPLMSRRRRSLLCTALQIVFPISLFVSCGCCIKASSTSLFATATSASIRRGMIRHSSLRCETSCCTLRRTNHRRILPRNSVHVCRRTESMSRPLRSQLRPHRQTPP